MEYKQSLSSSLENCVLEFCFKNSNNFRANNQNLKETKRNVISMENNNRIRNIFFFHNNA